MVVTAVPSVMVPVPVVSASVGSASVVGVAELDDRRTVAEAEIECPSMAIGANVPMMSPIVATVMMTPASPMGFCDAGARADLVGAGGGSATERAGQGRCGTTQAEAHHQGCGQGSQEDG